MIIEQYFGIDRGIAHRMIEATNTMEHDKSGDNGFQSTKVFLFDEYAVLKMNNITFRNVDTHDPELKHLERLTKALIDLYTEGVNVVPILAFKSDGADGYIIQQRAKGLELYDRNMMLNKYYVLERTDSISKAPQEHYNKFVKDTINIIRAGVLIDFIGKDNFFYHDGVGFQFIDINAHFDYEYGLSDVKPQAEQLASWNCFIPCYYDTVPNYRDNVSHIMTTLSYNEQIILQKTNKAIFEKCKHAMITNGISNDMLSAIISNEIFIPQKHLLGLI